MTGEKWTGKNLEGNGHDLRKVMLPDLDMHLPKQKL
jgi:hypothetical protein